MATGISRLPHAERLRGCVFHEDFESATSIAANGGTVTGSLEFDTDKGARFDGSNDLVTASAGTTYIDGKASASPNIGLGALRVFAHVGTLSGSGINIFTRYDAASGNFNGRAYYFALYPFALTPTQVANEYLLALENARLV